MRTITTTEDLAAFCAAAKDHPYVTIDTEFLRERTYWSKLCLIQMALPGKDGDAVLVDPIEGSQMSMEPLYDLFRHKATVKVFHAARQDLEIFFVEGNVFPDPLFDTQVAAMVCGFGEQVGYETLVKKIAKDRRLLRELRLYAPNSDGSYPSELKLSSTAMANNVSTVSYPSSVQTTDSQTINETEPPLILRELLVHRGEAVQAGAPLGTLVNYSELYIEGMAFEQDIVQLSAASDEDWKVTALFERADGNVREVPDLEIAYLDTEVDRASRTLKFFVALPNEVTHENKQPNGVRFVNWRYRPGQRLQLRVPVEIWEQQIVLPVEAVAREGAEYFVFQQNGDHFDRLPIHVKYRDQFSVVVANDGQLFPGDVVAMRNAHQMQMALKNKSGGGVDPHAGHNH